MISLQNNSASSSDTLRSVVAGSATRDSIKPAPTKRNNPVYRFPDADTVSVLETITPAETGILKEKVFSGHSLRPTHSTPIPVEIRNHDWFTIVVFLIVAGFTWIRVFY